MSELNIHEILINCKTLKPQDFIIDDIKWKHLVRGVIRAKNIMLIGDSGSGKTKTAQVLAKALNKNYFYFNLGACQDARSTLIGNVQFGKEKGTYFNESSFIKAIKTENSIILLDEITRCHPDGWNILLSVLDNSQRYVRLDEKENTEIINVANNVTFIATANVGPAYTSTRTLDRAILDRFLVIEIDSLSQEQEYSLLQLKFPLVDSKILKHISTITSHTREIVKSEESKISNYISTRHALEMAELAHDGFTLLEIATTFIYSMFSDEGGADSERTYIKQYLQQFLSTNVPEKINTPSTKLPW